MTRSTSTLCAALVPAFLVLAGCGDDGGTSDSSVPTDSGAGDSAAGDSSAPSDSGASDSAAPSDSSTGDSAVPMDSGDLDSTVGDTGAGDSGAGDSGVLDSGTPVDAGACVDLPPADRVTPISCSACRPTWADPGGSGACATHSDCTAGDNGRCVSGMIGPFCSYDQCFEDGDCAANEVCSCDGSAVGGGNRCVPSDCKVGADCTSGRCSPSYGCLLGGPPEGWYCRTAGDTCTADSECAMDGGLGGGRCAYDASAGHWACAYGICVF